jgi:hypothetical protein
MKRGGGSEDEDHFKEDEDYFKKMKVISLLLDVPVIWRKKQICIAELQVVVQGSHRVGQEPLRNG